MNGDRSVVLVARAADLPNSGTCSTGIDFPLDFLL